MADKHDHPDESGSPEFSDETIRRFLLGELSTSEQPVFEQRLIADDGLDARVRLVEIDLADDYAFQRLNASNRRRCEQKFLLTSDRQNNLRVSEALRDRFAATSAARTPLEDGKVAGRLRNLFGLGRPAWRIAFGVLILLILFGAALLVIKEPRIARPFIPRRSPATTPTPVQPSLTHHSSNQTATPVHSESPPTLPTHEPRTAPVVASFVLSPNRRQTATIPVVNLPDGKDGVLRFQLALKSNPLVTYRAELLTDEGRSVFTAESLATDGHAATIDFDVPARLLETGNYQIRIAGGSGPEARVTSYYFLAR